MDTTVIDVVVETPGRFAMKTIETADLILRPFQPEDGDDVLALALDWKSAPGPEFDKLPTDRDGCLGFTQYLCTQAGTCWALWSKADRKVVGLIGLNGVEEHGFFDIGHIIHSGYQDNRRDRDALEKVVSLVFETRAEVETVITKNADFGPQLAPLVSLGFTQYQDYPGQLVVTRAAWAADHPK